MSFANDFEKKTNVEMLQDGQPGQAPIETEDAVDSQDTHEKDHPPRFSTLFTPPPRDYVRECYPEPRKKSGIHISMPLFILFVAILFFESTIIFAYTIIGMYNNAPSRLFPWAGAGAGTALATACDCTLSQPAINISPNFVMPQAPAALTEWLTITVTPISSATSTTSTSTSTSTTSTMSSFSSSMASTQAAAMASDIAKILSGLGSRTTSRPIAIVTPTPVQNTVTSVKMITKDASGNVIAPTVTKTTFIDPPGSSSTATRAGDEVETQEPIVIRPTTLPDAK